MKEIIKFLKTDQSSFDDNNNPHISTIDYDKIRKINQSFHDLRSKSANTRYLKLNPSLTKGQIWSVKNSYYDYLGEKNTSSHPLLVIITSEVFSLDSEECIRIQVISPFTQLAAADDIICNDASVIGFPFMIETWNELPVLVDLLENYIGFFNANFNVNIENVFLDKFQEEFRSIEINSARYLSNSVLSLIQFVENKQTEDSGVVISLFGKHEFPEFFVDNQKVESKFSLAAKSGFDKEDRCIIWESSTIPFKVYIRKDAAGFIITVTPYFESLLFDEHSINISGTIKDNRIVFCNLSSGLYILSFDNDSKQIIIRIK